MYTLGTMRIFKTQNFTVIADAVKETSPDFSWDETGEILTKVDNGEYLCFTARVRVLLHDREVGTDYLGNCIYASLDAFMDHRACGKQNREYAAQGKEGRCGSYFSDMIHSAIAEARNTLTGERQIRVRA